MERWLQEGRAAWPAGQQGWDRLARQSNRASSPPALRPRTLPRFLPPMRGQAPSSNALRAAATALRGPGGGGKRFRGRRTGHAGHALGRAHTPVGRSRQRCSSIDCSSQWAAPGSAAPRASPSLLHIGLVGLSHPEDLLAGARVQHREGLAALSVHPLASDEQLRKGGGRERCEGWGVGSQWQVTAAHEWVGARMWQRQRGHTSAELRCREAPRGG